MTLTNTSLFSGCKGLDLGAYRAGIKTIQCSDIITYEGEGIKILNNAKELGDITKIETIEYTDIISGGFPCQDISASNFKANGIVGERSGLWSDFFRLIKQGRPKYALIENSPNLLKKGFEIVLHDLSKIGYDAQWECISNEAFGFPHKRTRLFVIAYPSSERQSRQGNIFKDCCNYQESREWETNNVIDAIQRKTLPSLCESNHGFSHKLVKDGKKTNADKAMYGLGNAVNPFIAEYLYRCIIDREKLIQQEIK